MTAHLKVNEARVLACGGPGAGWWADFRLRFDPIGRIHVDLASIGGDLVRVECDDREHADWLRATAQEHGVPAAALKVVNA